MSAASVALAILAIASAETLVEDSGLRGRGVQYESQKLNSEQLSQARAECEKRWSDYNCQALRDSLPEAEKSKVINCSQPESYAPLKSVVGVAHGLGEFVIDTAEFADKAARLSGHRGPIAQIQQTRDFVKGTTEIIRAAQSTQTCNEDEEYKKRLIEKLPPDLRNQGTTEKLMAMTCNELGGHVQRRLRELQDEIAKKQTLQRDYETFLNSTARRFGQDEALRRAEAYIAKEKRELNPSQQYVLDTDERRKLLEEAWSDVVQQVSTRAQCFTTQEKSRLIARVAAEVFSPFVPLKALKGAQLISRIEGVLAKSGLPAAVEKVAERSVKFPAGLQRDAPLPMGKNRFGPTDKGSGTDETIQKLNRDGVSVANSQHDPGLIRVLPEGDHFFAKLAKKAEEKGYELVISPSSHPYAYAAVDHEKKVAYLFKGIKGDFRHPENLGAMFHEVNGHVLESGRGTLASRIKINVDDFAGPDLALYGYGTRSLFRGDEPISFFRGGAIEKATSEGAIRSQLSTGQIITRRTREILSDFPESLSKHLSYNASTGEAVVKYQHDAGRLYSAKRREYWLTDNPVGTYSITFQIPKGLSREASEAAVRKAFQEYQRSLDRLQVLYDRHLRR